MNAIQFDEDKAAKISYEDLAKTMELGNGMAEMPAACPKQPGELIMDICDAVRKYSKLEPTVAPIIIREPYCNTNRKALKEKQGEEAFLKLEHYAVRRLVARIDLPMEEFVDTKDHMNASICLSYSNTDALKSIQIGFGENVQVCENRTIFGGFQFSTQGQSKVPFDEGMQLLHHWLQNIDTVHGKHIAVIKKLMKTRVHITGLQRIIGSLFEKAVRFNNGERAIMAPLNQSQVGDMIKLGIDILKSHDESKGINAWEILNWGTSVLKAEKSDMTNLLSDTANYNTFLLSEFKIEPDFAI